MPQADPKFNPQIRTRKQRARDGVIPLRAATLEDLTHQRAAQVSTTMMVQMAQAVARIAPRPELAGDPAVKELCERAVLAFTITGQKVPEVLEGFEPWQERAF